MSSLRWQTDVVSLFQGKASNSYERDPFRFAPTIILTLLRFSNLAVTQGEIEALYKRFRTLDRSRKVRSYKNLTHTYIVYGYLLPLCSKKYSP